MHWFWSELLRFSIYGSIGFVIGASWCAVHTKNRMADFMVEYEKRTPTKHNKWR